MPRTCFITRAIPDRGLDVLRQSGVEFEIGQPIEDQPLDPGVLRDACARHDVVISLLTETLDRELLDAAPRLRGVANVAVGYDNVDVAAATELGIPVSNTPEVLTDATADLTFALLLAIARRIPEAHAYTTAGRFRIWGPQLLLGAGVGPGPDGGDRKVLGIVGFGRIGRAVHKRSTGFDMEVLAFDPGEDVAIDAPPGVRFVELEELLARSDFVTLHAPLQPSTRHLIGTAELRAMKPTAYLINTSRGQIVDEAALVRALAGGWIAGAGLDVYEDEPALAPGLAELDNVVLLPHIGSATTETRGRMAEMAAENALCHLRGDPAPNVVDAAVYEQPAWRARQA